MFTETPEFHEWLEELAAMPGTPTAENLYDDSTHGQARLANLREYFNQMALLSPKVILVGEAPGYQGSRRTGIPFGSEHIISGGLPEVTFFQNGDFHKVLSDIKEHKEPTATIVWRTISQYERLPLLWAAYPLHPHQPGNTESNRTPTRKEVASVKEHLLKLLGIVGVESVLSLGNTAKAVLDDLGIKSHKIRHPAHGGGPTFARQLDEVMHSI